ncbi:MAG: thioredoxin-disulfide reductase [Chloroflexota bacterium]
MAEYQVVIIGGGPAGLTAGLYASRAGLKSRLVERGIFGGQIVNGPWVETYPGFPEGLSGYDLAELMHQQAIKYGLETVNVEVTGLTPGTSSHTVLTSEGKLEAETVIIAAGAEHTRLGAPGEEKFAGKGVAYCATCDGFLFRDKMVAVVGGGDTALTDALELAQHASRVYVIHRRDQLRAGKVLQERALAQPKMEFIWDTVVDEVLGDKLVSELKLRQVRTGKTSRLKVDGVFVAIGVRPNSQPFAGVVELDPAGGIVTDDMMATAVPGIFAAGDIRRNSVRQVASAVGDGATAALAAARYLQSKV